MRNIQDMPTLQGWPTADEERAMRDVEKIRRGKTFAINPGMFLTISLTRSDWDKLLEEEPDIRTTLRRLLGLAT